MRRGILLYGPPASGKDTVTAALGALDARYVPFSRLKIGSGKTDGYRPGTPEHLADLEARGDVIYRNERYGNVYVVDRPGLERAMVGTGIPVIHLGQMAGMDEVSVRFPARWARVLLWCSRESSAERSRQRGDADTAARLAAWEATEADLAAHPHARWDVRVETDTTAPQDTARIIDTALRAAASRR